ncbi:hypothetical protein A3A70_03020 [candidate division WWE3 bacterium RIFCSPLOWO2_01_FULL_42_11]|uniref:Uncharacterized protein n=2 Tax=Bacteria candidate phyla TaxID=1783234 RepID=A0A1F4VRK9_UNCKA|nr:MAG: hypothetical protein A3A70_03020 [candidate division WWE3 bacterium RIFCSPLOWO2_01_FULL_42_11]OGG15298.1 MAG: hypothetical protein A2773_03115 [Candidatus Gottesmanbacteria bacterium RIFCSPHIGHO2_01_FULL_39_10]
MESHETPAVEATPTGASDSFLNKLRNRLDRDPAMRTMGKVLSGTKTSAALTTVFGLMTAGQATEGGTSGVVGATMLGLLTAEMAGITAINAVRDRRANKQQKPQ